MAFINFVKGNKSQYSTDTYPNSVFFAADTHELFFQGISYGFSNSDQVVKSVDINATGLMTVTYLNGGSDTVQLTKAMVGLSNVDNTADKDKPVSDATTQAINNLKTTVDGYTINGKKISTSPALEKGDIGLGNVTNDAQVKRSEMGVANGVATLDSDGKIPASQLNGQLAHVFGIDGVATSSTLPSSDVNEGDIYWTTDNKKFYNYNGSGWDDPMDPKDDTIYNFRNGDKTGDTGRTNILYRWDGQDLVEISASIALGESAGTAYEGIKGKANRDALTSLPNTIVANVSRGTIGATSMVINISKVTKSGLNYGEAEGSTVDIPSATGSAAGLMSATDKTNHDSLWSSALASISVENVVLANNSAGNQGTVTLKLTKVAGGAATDVPFNITIPLATGSTNGVMSGTDKTKLDGIQEGANNYSLPLATSEVRGGIKVGYTAMGKNYAVQLSDEKAFVNVPWTDTKVSQLATSTETTGGYYLLLSYMNSSSQAGEVNPVRKAKGLIYNPADEVLTTSTFKGDLEGNADTATKATEDASGNVITSTYATKTEVTSKIEALITRIAALEAALTIQNV